MRTTVMVGAALGVLLIALAVGCGSKKSASSSQTTTTNSSSSSSGTSTEVMTNEATTTTTSGSGSSGTPSFSSTKNCKQLESLAARVTQSFRPDANGNIDVGKEADALNSLADAAPDDIKSDLHTFADAFTNFAKAYGEAKIKVGQQPSAEQIAKLATASQALSTPKLQAAIKHLSTWGSSHCGISSTSP